ncbi:MAG: hypothetical protein ABEJ28_12525 [Salinigranum sp.]
MWIIWLYHGLVVIAALGLLVRYRSALSRDRPDPSEWFSQVSAAGRELHDAVESHSNTAASDRLENALLPIAARLDRLTRNAPRSVDSAYVGRIHRLGAECKRIGYGYDSRATRPDGARGEPLENIRTRAERLVEDTRNRAATAAD